MTDKIYPILPLRDVVVFPHVIVPLFIGREKSIAALDAAMNGSQELLLVPQRDPAVVEPTLADLHEIGSLGRIVQMAKLSDGTVKALVEGLYRVHLKALNDDEKMFSAKKRNMLEKNSTKSEEHDSIVEVLIEEFAKYLRNQERSADELLETLRGINDIGRISDTIAAHMDFRIEERVHLLAMEDAYERSQRLMILLAQESEKNELNKKIKNRVKQQMERNQREYYLNEKIKAIQKELGEMDEAQNDIELLEAQIKKAKMPVDVEKKALSELNKLKQMSAMSSEANVIRNYLEWLIDYPWAIEKPARYDLEEAARILDRDHYGLEDVKERILEYLAVQKRINEHNQKDAGTIGKGPIICLIGPPGVGKTSLGKSIAEATGRDFDRIALGGLHDEAEIRGHRRTYIGALPGKIVQKLCKLGSNNPVILLDEIDKIGHDHHGDPAAALLEVLDPAQNHTFNDHYLETDIDLSNVLFIATANTLNISEPLLDRMEVIRLPGYTTQEKIQIAKRYIVPRQRKENVLKASEFKIKNGVLNDVIEDYTREAGVRNLEREIGKLARKSVRRLQEGKQKSILITPNNLKDFLGVAKYHRNDEDLQAKIGSVTGLAWTSVGGELLQIEGVAFSGKGRLTHTGQLGDVMQESIRTALSVVRSYLDDLDDNFRFDEYDIHLHLPEGATPKDGPSAGIAMATALLSALSKQAVRGDLAMTGEITLHGKVLAIGGLKEKLLAAQRGRLKMVLIPEDNLKDLDEIPEEVKAALEIVPVSHIHEVFDHAFVADHAPFKARIEQKSLPTVNAVMHETPAGRC